MKLRFPNYILAFTLLFSVAKICDAETVIDPDLQRFFDEKLGQLLIDANTCLKSNAISSNLTAELPAIFSLSTEPALLELKLDNGNSVKAIVSIEAIYSNEENELRIKKHKSPSN